MSYAGVVSREHSSGGKIRRGAITKSGNAHIRRMMVEAAWHYRHRPGLRHGLGKRSSRPERGSQKDRVEGAVTTHTAIPAVGSAQAQASGSCSGRPGIARLHLAIGMQVETEPKLVLVIQPSAGTNHLRHRSASRRNPRLKITRDAAPARMTAVRSPS
jgi:Transposase IS116/IS110/IS902 family